MSNRLGRNFFARETLAVARDLLGKRLVRRLVPPQICNSPETFGSLRPEALATGPKRVRGPGLPAILPAERPDTSGSARAGLLVGGRIVEVEAYVGETDTACHASRGPTPRNRVLYGPPGTAYVYFTYGMHWLLNVVTEREGYPAAVLLRAIEPDLGLEHLLRARPGRRQTELTSGPARLTLSLGIDGAFNSVDLTTSKDLWIEDAPPLEDDQVRRCPRVGIDYAAPRDRRAPWRLLVTGSLHLSRAPGGQRPTRRKR